MFAFSFMLRLFSLVALLLMLAPTAHAQGGGGFGGGRGSNAAWELPEGPPDHEVGFVTRPEQALLYRLNGDDNPLHPATSEPCICR